VQLKLHTKHTKQHGILHNINTYIHYNQSYRARTTKYQ